MCKRNVNTRSNKQRKVAQRDAGEVGDGKDGVDVRDLARIRAQHVQQSQDHERHARLAGTGPLLSPAHAAQMK